MKLTVSFATDIDSYGDSGDEQSHEEWVGRAQEFMLEFFCVKGYEVEVLPPTHSGSITIEGDEDGLIAFDLENDAFRYACEKA